MHAGRPASKRDLLPLRKNGFTEPLSIKDAATYVVKRQNDDEGYAFCQGMESNAQDTYYGLATLHRLKVRFPNPKKTIRWLKEFVPYGLHSSYYVAKAWDLCGRDLDSGVNKYLQSIHISKTRSDSTSTHGSRAFRPKDVLMITELLNMTRVETNQKKTTDLLLGYQNRDGGFGLHGQSDLESTYQVVASLHNLNFPVKSLKATLEYVRSCEAPTGGFSLIPNTSPPHMEYTYHGASILDLLGEKANNPKLARYVFRCQQSNGGFARSEFGISTFEDTFYAVSVLQKIGRLQKTERKEALLIPLHLGNKQWMKITREP